MRDSRNYYTHYSSELKDKSLHGMELYYLTQRLKLLLTFALLLDSGFSKELLNKHINDKLGILL